MYVCLNISWPASGLSLIKKVLRILLSKTMSTCATSGAGTIYCFGCRPRYILFCVVFFVAHCLFFCPLSVGHGIVCYLWINVLSLPLFISQLFLF